MSIVFLYFNKILFKNKHLLFCFISFFINSFYCIAQQDTLVYYQVSNKTLEQCEIRNITGTADGKIWLSTNKGIASFDGNEVHFFDHKRGDINTIWSSSISFLQPVPDVKGNLYVVTVTGHTYYFNTKTGKVDYLDTRAKSEDSANIFFYPKPYADLFIEDDSVIWGGRYFMGFVKYNLVSKKTKIYNLPFGYDPRLNTVNAIKKGNKNSNLLWLATSNGIYSFDRKTEEFKKSFKGKNSKDFPEAPLDILNIEVANEDTIWFTSRAGVGCYEISKGGLYNIPISVIETNEP